MSEIEKNWDHMALAYEDFTESEDSYSYTIEWPCIQSMLTDLKDKDVLDLGCGTARFTFLFEKLQPRKITGIDLSEAMLNIAKKKAATKLSSAVFIKEDISRFNADEQYDFIFSSTVTHYIKDLQGLFERIYSALRSRGFCIISAMNPVYTSQYPISRSGLFPNDDEWVVRYLDKSERSYIQPWIEYNDEIENYLSSSFHHTFSDYINAIAMAGFSIVEMQEPAPPEKWKTEQPERYNAFIETPSFMVLKLLKC